MVRVDALAPGANAGAAADLVAEAGALPDDCALPVDAANALQPAGRRIEMLQHARAHRAALADVERRAALAIEEIDARCFRNRIDHRSIELRRQRRLLRHLAGRHREDVFAMLLGRDAQELPQRVGIAHRAVPRRAGEAVARDQAVEAVSALARIEPAGELDAAHGGRMELYSRAVELAPHESIV